MLGEKLRKGFFDHIYGMGQLGLGDANNRGDNANEMGQALPGTRLLTPRLIAAGPSAACAAFKEGDRIKCWGSPLGYLSSSKRGDNANEMGGYLPFVDLGESAPFLDIAFGSDHACVLLDGESVKCWGRNRYGQLGLGDTNTRYESQLRHMGANLPAVSLGTGAVATAVAAGSYNTCALLEGGSVKCWGGNSSGQLGLGDTDDRGDEAGEMGTNLPAVALGGSATAIATGGGHTCALLEDGSVKCWGGNSSGQLGLGDTDDRGDEAGEMGSALPTVALGGKATALSAGSGYTCALLSNGSVKCWGDNDNGRLGLGDEADRGDEAGEMGTNLPAVDLGPGAVATAVSAWSNHTCALLEGGSVKCWGSNNYGQLGLGDVDDRGDEAGEMGTNLPAVALGMGAVATAVVAGREFTCALLEGGLVKCWGRNLSGQLGLGDRYNRRVALSATEL